MARTPTKKTGKPATKARASKSKNAKSARTGKPARPKSAGSKSRGSKPGERTRRKQHATTAEAIAGLLETPLVAEVIAAGAAAALATLTQQALSKKAQGGTASALKDAARAAASAMGTRLAEELNEIVDGAGGAKRGSG